MRAIQAKRLARFFAINFRQTSCFRWTLEAMYCLQRPLGTLKRGMKLPTTQVFNFSFKRNFFSGDTFYFLAIRDTLTQQVIILPRTSEKLPYIGVSFGSAVSAQTNIILLLYGLQKLTLLWTSATKFLISLAADTSSLWLASTAFTSSLRMVSSGGSCCPPT